MQISEVIYSNVAQNRCFGCKTTLQLIGEGYRSGSGAARCVNDGPKRAVLLGNKADGAAGQDPGQRYGPAIVGRAVLHSARKG